MLEDFITWSHLHLNPLHKYLNQDLLSIGRVCMEMISSVIAANFLIIAYAKISLFQHPHLPSPGIKFPLKNLLFFVSCRQENKQPAYEIDVFK